MKLEHMTGPEHPLYAAAWALYEAAFPANERRDAEWQARALAQDAYHMCAAAEDGALCAIAFYWMHGGELFLEHLAVASEQRRLRFYEREGLTLAPFGYDAPGYQAGTGDCALQLMSEGAMSKLEFARHCAFLQEVVLDCTAGGAKPLCIWKE